MILCRAGTTKPMKLTPRMDQMIRMAGRISSRNERAKE